jgi:hypothetical protein
MYTPNPLPGETDLGMYLQHELQRISIALQTMLTPRVQYAKLHAAPPNPREGIVVLADGLDWDPGSGSGLYIYIAEVWQPLFVEGNMEDVIAGLPSQIADLAADVATRAPADTALSIVTWTETRAESLDKIEENPTARPPITSGLIAPETLTGISGSVNTIIGRVCDSVTSSTHTYTGSGVLNLVAQDNATGGGVASTCTITIDGEVIYSFSATIASVAVQSHVGFISNTAVAFDQIPFHTSLSIAATGRPAHFKYRKTS